MASDIDHLPNVPLEQRRIRALCYHPTGTFMPFSQAAIERSIPERFEEMVRLYPDRLAVKDEGEILSYAELNRKANRLAHAILQRRGARTEPVALLFEQGAEAIAAILGILKAGKCYVPLDPAYPSARLAYMLEDAQAALVVTNAEGLSVARRLGQPECRLLNVELLGAGVPPDNPGSFPSPDTLAYVIYTSGSTGHPKGVMETHRNVLHKIMEYTNSLHICAADRLSVLYSPSSSASVWDIFSGLCKGASLFPFLVEDARIGHLARWLHQEGVTIYSSVPTLFRQVVSTMTAGERLSTLRLMYLGGETVSPHDVALYKAHCAPECRLVTSLAATEAGTFCRYFIDAETRITGNAVPVGYTVPDKDVLLLDADGKEVSIDGIGEIVVRSRYLSPGYWRRPDLTQARFAPDPEGGETRFYRTGDLGRMRPDGCLVHVGREDFQVKIRGHRVETAEIELALRQLDSVKEAAVIQRDDKPGVPRLVAYLVLRPRRPAPTVSALRRDLAKALPRYMIPGTFVILDALPLSPGRKVDRHALPVPERARPLLEHAYVPPRTPIEAELAAIWADVLGLDQVGVHDPFPELGGDSLVATQILARVIRTLQVDVPLRALLETPSIATMAVVIARHKAEQADSGTITRLLTEVETLRRDIS